MKQPNVADVLEVTFNQAKRLDKDSVLVADKNAVTVKGHTFVIRIEGGLIYYSDCSGVDFATIPVATFAKHWDCLDEPIEAFLDKRVIVLDRLKVNWNQFKQKISDHMCRYNTHHFDFDLDTTYYQVYIFDISLEFAAGDRECSELAFAKLLGFKEE